MQYTFYNASSKLFSVHQFSSNTCWLSRVPSWRGGALVSTEMHKCSHTTSVGREETRQKVGVARGAWHLVESTAGAPPTRSHIWEGYNFCLSTCFNDVFLRLKHWLSNCMRHDLFIHVYFTLKLVVKNKGWLHSAPPFERRHLYSDLSRHIKERQNSIIVWISWKKLNDLFGTHAYQTERPVPKMFLYRYTPLYIYIS